MAMQRSFHEDSVLSALPPLPPPAEPPASNFETAQLVPSSLLPLPPLAEPPDSNFQILLQNADDSHSWNEEHAISAALSLSVPCWVKRLAVEVTDAAGENGVDCALAGNGRRRVMTPRVSAAEAIDLVVGRNDVMVNFLSKVGRPSMMLHVDRQEVQDVLPDVVHLPGYERARLSVFVFLVVFAYAVNSEVRAIVAVPILASIVLIRILPDPLVNTIIFVRTLTQKVLVIIRTRLANTAAPIHQHLDERPQSIRDRHPFPRLGRHYDTEFRVLGWRNDPHFLNKYSCYGAVLSVAFAFISLAILRGTYGPGARQFAPAPSISPQVEKIPPLPQADATRAKCSGLPGLDCSQALAQWVGSDCAFLATTNGTCKGYCEMHRRECLKAVDDAGWPGICVMGQESMSSDSCLEDWRTQICVCSATMHPPDSAKDQPLVLHTDDIPIDKSEELPTTTTATTTTSVLSVQRESVGSCFIKNEQRVPDMPASNRIVVASTEHCQDHCHRTAGCAFFTWHLQSRECSVHEYVSERMLAPNVISGPSGCNDEAELAALTGKFSSWGSLSSLPAPLPAPLMVLHRNYRLADIDGSWGYYNGPVNAKGEAHGSGMLQYDEEGYIFIGDFVHGLLMQGVVFQELSVHSSMKDYAWTDFPVHQATAEVLCRRICDWEAFAELPDVEQYQEVCEMSTRRHTRDHTRVENRQPESEPVAISKSEPEREEVRNPDGGPALTQQYERNPELPTPTAPFMSEGSPYTVILVVIVFVVLAASGVLDNKQ